MLKSNLTSGKCRHFHPVSKMRRRKIRSTILSIVSPEAACREISHKRKDSQETTSFLDIDHPIVHVRYRDHVLYHRGNPELFSPQIRECVGWLIREEEEFIVLGWDADRDQLTPKTGDSKWSGLVLLRSDILEMRRVA